METAPAAEATQATRSHFWLIFLLGALAALGPFSIDTYLPAFPAIAQTFHTTVGDVEATLAVYFVGLSLGQLFMDPSPIATAASRRSTSAWRYSS